RGRAIDDVAVEVCLHDRARGRARVRRADTGEQTAAGALSARGREVAGGRLEVEETGDVDRRVGRDLRLDIRPGVREGIATEDGHAEREATDRARGRRASAREVEGAAEVNVATRELRGVLGERLHSRSHRRGRGRAAAGEAEARREAGSLSG